MEKRQFSQRQKTFGRRTSPRRILAATAALLVAFLLLASVIGLAEKYIALRGRMRDLKEEREELMSKQAALKETNRYIETKEGEERELRAKYNVIKPGEGIVVITEPASLETKEGPSTRVGRWWDSLLRGLGLRKD